MKEKKVSITDRKEIISKVLFAITIFFLSFVFVNITISSILFIFKISITKFNGIFSLLISCICTIIYLEKNKIINKKIIFFLLVILLMMLLSLTYISGKVIDYTYDGNSYHKATIGMMMEGWNPLYENMEDFDKNKDKPMEITSSSYLWGNHYAKASHIFAANIASITGNIESGKVLNLISIIIVFNFVFSLMIHLKKGYIFSLLFSLCIVTCPTICSQFLTNYVDLLVYLYFFLLIALFFRFEYDKENYKDNLIIYFMTLSILINIKFSAFAYAGIFCLGYYILYIIRLKNKESKKFFISFSCVSAVSLIVGLFIIGLSVYPKNYLDHGNIFYPLFGEQKVDIMTENEPYYFENKSSIEKFAIATFSKADNIIRSSKKEATYKIPFAIYGEEIRKLAANDLRISGNGLLFSGILIISVLLLLYLLIKTKRKNRELDIMLIIPIIITIIMIFTMEDVWWARYFPQIHLIVFAAIIKLSNEKDKKTNIIKYVLISIILINNLSFIVPSMIKSYNFTKTTNTNMYNFENNCDSLTNEMVLYTTSFHGTYYNIIEKEKKYNINFDNYENLDKSDYYVIANNYVFAKCVSKE